MKLRSRHLSSGFTFVAICVATLALSHAAQARELLVASRDPGVVSAACGALQAQGALPAAELHTSRWTDQAAEYEAALTSIDHARQAYLEGEIDRAWEDASRAIETLGRSLGVAQDFDAVARAYLFHADLATARDEAAAAEDSFLIAARLGPQLELDPANTSPLVIEGYTTASALLASSPPGGLTVQSQPAGATVWVDDEERGGAPLSVTLPAGPHLVRVELDGYELWATQVPVEAGNVRELEIYLTEAGPLDLAIAAPTVERVRALQQLDGERDWLVVERVDEGLNYTLVTAEGTAVDGGPILPLDLVQVVELARSGGEVEVDPVAQGAPLHWGWIVAGVSGGVAALSAAGALAIEGVFQLSSLASGEERQGMQLGERILFGTTLLGVVGGGVGTVLALEAADE